MMFNMFVHIYSDLIRKTFFLQIILELQVEVVGSKSMRTSKSGNLETFIQDTFDTTIGGLSLSLIRPIQRNSTIINMRMKDIGQK